MSCIMIVISFHEHVDFFIEDNKNNEYGGEFLRKLKIFKIFAFLHLVFYV